VAKEGLEGRQRSSVTSDRLEAVDALFRVTGAPVAGAVLGVHVDLGLAVAVDVTGERSKERVSGAHKEERGRS